MRSSRGSRAGRRSTGATTSRWISRSRSIAITWNAAEPSWTCACCSSPRSRCSPGAAPTDPDGFPSPTAGGSRVSVFAQIALGWARGGSTLPRMVQPGLWPPWLLLGAVHLVALLMLAGFAHPAVSAVMAPLVTALAGAGVRHYPEVFRQLPELQAQTGFVVDALLGPIAAGAAVAMLAAAFERGRGTAGDALVHALERAGALGGALLP